MSKENITFWNFANQLHFWSRHDQCLDVDCLQINLSVDYRTNPHLKLIISKYRQINIENNQIKILEHYKKTSTNLYALLKSKWPCALDASIGSCSILVE